MGASFLRNASAYCFPGNDLNDFQGLSWQINLGAVSSWREARFARYDPHDFEGQTALDHSGTSREVSTRISPVVFHIWLAIPSNAEATINTARPANMNCFAWVLEPFHSPVINPQTLDTKIAVAMNNGQPITEPS